MDTVAAPAAPWAKRRAAPSVAAAVAARTEQMFGRQHRSQQSAQHIRPKFDVITAKLIDFTDKLVFTFILKTIIVSTSVGKALGDHL